KSRGFSPLKMPVGGGSLDRLPTRLSADAGERLQLAFVVASEADHKMGQPGVGVSREPVGYGGRRAGGPPLVLLHHPAAARVGMLQKLVDTRSGPRIFVAEEDGQVHRAVERIQAAARLAPHRETLPPLLAEEFRRGPDREPAVEIARGALHRA